MFFPGDRLARIDRAFLNRSRSAFGLGREMCREVHHGFPQQSLPFWVSNKYDVYITARNSDQIFCFVGNACGEPEVASRCMDRYPSRCIR